MLDHTGFRVIIAGGGVAGLTLANALEQANIDYVLLERRDTIAPQVGASIGIARYLKGRSRYYGSQIVTIRDAWSARDLMSVGSDWRGEYSSDSSELFDLIVFYRTGYDFLWGDRQVLLETLFENIQDKGKVLMNKNIVDIEHKSDGVIVRCDDGSSFRGDILAGADGVRSKTREELWKLAKPIQPDLVMHDENNMIAEYRCLFGIATGIQHFDSGDLDIGYNTGRSTLTIAAKNGRVYYFIMERMKEVYRLKDIPHYSQAEAEEFALQHGDMCIRPNLKFSHLWENTISFRLVPLEEGKFKIWTWGRIACLGDSIHKMTPNLGAGGNAAIESAAALANSIKAMVGKHPEGPPPMTEVKKCLDGYQRSRESRAASIVDICGKVTRLQAVQGTVERLFFWLFLPRLGDFLADMGSNIYIGAPMLEYLPPPKASLGGTMPFNPTQGEDKKESKVKRALVTLPLLGLFYLTRRVLDVSESVPWALQMLETGKVSADTHSVPIRQAFYNINWLDSFWAPINMYFVPIISGFDAASRKQLLSFLTDYGVIIAIWAIESNRRNNALTPAQLPSLFTLLGQIRGIGVISPLYYALHYISSPIENFKATDMRLTRMNNTLSILPAMILTYYIPFCGMMFSPTLLGRQSWLFVWQMFPIWIGIMTSILPNAFPSTTMSDRINAPKRDLPLIRFMIGSLVGLSACVWIWAWSTAPYGEPGIFFPITLPLATSDLTAFMREFLKFDETFLFAATFIWLGCLFWDMKHAGMLQVSWLKIVIYATCTVVILGPGAAAGLGWLWREDIITNRRHKAAVTEATAARWIDAQLADKKGIE
ncbi:FAD NAD(P)-binding domain protein [Fusarium beomiforme]|uniref:FAD NAD(P)-binding domain protein n=1 Tax=Fusarium beomiforme TaxID=44412 RepID=A0A9P5A8C1_9HYPO|nr:FAD NAD(P)-binding domain protein [Fusarium beomiforme]